MKKLKVNKHGEISSQAKALKLFAGTGRHLTLAEQKAKAKLLNFPKGKSKKVNTIDYQRKFGRAYND